MPPTRDIGEFIRDLRNNARISLRQLAEKAGVSNPYLSQIERGLRKPSAEVLRQIASALRVSTPVMYLRAGLLENREGTSVLAAITTDPDLTSRQKQTLADIYETFRRENARDRVPEPAEPTEPTESSDTPEPTDTTGEPAWPDAEAIAEAQAAVRLGLLEEETGTGRSAGRRPSRTAKKSTKPAKE